MQTKILWGGRIAVLSLLIVLIFWYHNELVERFEPIQRLLPSQGFKTPVGTVSSSELINELGEPQSTTGIPDAVQQGEAASDPAVSDSKTSGVLSETSISDYVRAIFDPADTTFDRLECRSPDASALERYAALLNNEPTALATGTIRFFFALDLTQCLDLLPRLMGSIIETIRFLGPENCALSIVEGNSNDGTPEVLAALRTHVEAMGTEYYFETSSVNPKAGERIEGLAALRNLALQPMLDDRRRYSGEKTTIIFLNDVAACMEDILELAYQRVHLEADMSCAMDWTYLGRDPTFYDVWISRTLSGEAFFNIPEDGSWDYAWNLFWKDPDTKSRWSSHLPFQVFSCWNGAVTITAKPILNNDIAFRSSNPGECYQGEPELLCKDMWAKGYNKIAVIPAVNLEYSDDRARDLKALKGYTSRWVGPEQDVKSRIEWKQDPPDLVKCMGVMDKPDWRPWNETLT